MTEFGDFWVTAPWNVVVGYQRFGGPCCFHLNRCGNLKSRFVCNTCWILFI